MWANMGELFLTCGDKSSWKIEICFIKKVKSKKVFQYMTNTNRLKFLCVWTDYHHLLSSKSSSSLSHHDCCYFWGLFSPESNLNCCVAFALYPKVTIVDMWKWLWQTGFMKNSDKTTANNVPSLHFLLLQFKVLKLKFIFKILLIVMVFIAPDSNIQKQNIAIHIFIFS